MESELTIGASSQRSGVAPSALRYYEAEKLIHAVRTAKGQRRYTLRRVSFIRVARTCACFMLGWARADKLGALR